MENLCLKIMNKNMEALAVARGENEVNLVYTGEYQEGDIIILEVSEGIKILVFSFGHKTKFLFLINQCSADYSNEQEIQKNIVKKNTNNFSTISEILILIHFQMI